MSHGFKKQSSARLICFYARVHTVLGPEQKNQELTLRLKNSHQKKYLNNFFQYYHRLFHYLIFLLYLQVSLQ